MREFSNSLIEEILRDAEKVINKDELYEKIKTKKKLKIKFGIDPTASDIHLGHTVILRRLKAFQNLGHEICFIIGDFTAQIGDPSFQKKERKRLPKEIIQENVKTYLNQIFKILDKEKTKIFYNSEWFCEFRLSDFLELLSVTTAQRILQRDDFQQRLKANLPLSALEFIYPLLQGYDSVKICADVEVGGSDQLFNLLFARDMQKQFSQEPQVVITYPLLEGTDGRQKMSKSYGNYIAIEEKPKEMFGKLMSIPDNLIIKYMRLLTPLEEEEIKKYELEMKQGRVNPRDLKIILATEIVKLYHTEEEANKAKEEFQRVFSKRQMPSDMETYQLTGETKLVDFLVDYLNIPSRSEAKRLIKQGAVRINSEKIEDINLVLKDDVVVSVSRRKFAKVIIKRNSQSTF